MLFAKRRALLLSLLLVVVGTNGVFARGRTVSVKILVDEEEPRTRKLWTETLAKRVDRASVILSRYGLIRFSVTKFGTWQSDNAHLEFAKSLKEFESEVKADPAELAIGFSSQYRLTPGRSNLGGTRGPLRTHILIREGSPKIGEPERLEVLVHELAHYLGAAHSGRTDSVMRPILGDGQSRARSFQIKLDTTNANIVRLVTNDMVDFRAKHMHQLQLATRIRLRDLYLRLAEEAPEDPVAIQYVAYMEKSIRASRALARRRANQASQNAGSGASANPTPRPGSPPSALAPQR